MSHLIAIGYPDETTAAEAEKEAEALVHEHVIKADAIAAVVRLPDGRFKVTTSHHEVGSGTVWGLWWGLLFGLLFFVPFFGIAVGAGFGALFGKLKKAGVDEQFEQEARNMVEPGTSALFLVVDKLKTDVAIERLGKFGGTVLTTSLAPDVEAQLQEELAHPHAPQA
jgi:uncharacterized membrane protein